MERDRAQAGSMYRKKLDFVQRAPFVSVVFFFRSDYKWSKLKIMLHIVGRQEQSYTRTWQMHYTSYDRIASSSFWPPPPLKDEDSSFEVAVTTPDHPRFKKKTHTHTIHRHYYKRETTTDAAYHHYHQRTQQVDDGCEYPAVLVLIPNDSYTTAVSFLGAPPLCRGSYDRESTCLCFSEGFSSEEFHNKLNKKTD